MKIQTILTQLSLLDAGTDISSAPVSSVINTAGAEAITLLASVTGASSDVITITVETSADGITYYPLSVLSDASGSTSVYNRDFDFTMDATANVFQIPLNVQNRWTKITIEGDGTNTAKLDVEVLS